MPVEEKSRADNALRWGRFLFLPSRTLPQFTPMLHKQHCKVTNPPKADKSELTFEMTKVEVSFHSFIIIENSTHNSDQDLAAF